MPMVNTPHGLFASAFTTTIPSPASDTSRMNSTAIIATRPGKRADLRARDIGQRAALVPDRGDQHREVLHASGQHRADQQPEESRRKSELRRQRRPHQRAGSGDRREMVSEQHPLRRRDVIVPVLQRVRGGDAPVVQRQRFRGDERAVIPVGERVDAQRAQQDRERCS